MALTQHFLVNLVHWRTTEQEWNRKYKIRIQELPSHTFSYRAASWGLFVHKYWPPCGIGFVFYLKLIKQHKPIANWMFFAVRAVVSSSHSYNIQAYPGCSALNGAGVPWNSALPPGPKRTSVRSVCTDFRHSQNKLKNVGGRFEGTWWGLSETVSIIENDWKLSKQEFFEWMGRAPHPGWGGAPHRPPHARTFDIPETNSQKWMVRLNEEHGGFLELFLFWKTDQNWKSTIEFSGWGGLPIRGLGRAPHGLPMGSPWDPHEDLIDFEMETQKTGWCDRKSMQIPFRKGLVHRKQIKIEWEGKCFVRWGGAPHPRGWGGLPIAMGRVKNELCEFSFVSIRFDVDR